MNINLSSLVAGNVQMRANRLLREHVRAVLSQYELTPTHWSMLTVIAEARDGVRHAEIAQLLHIKAPLVTTLAQDLLRRGLVRTADNQFDGRVKLLAMTAEGKKQLETIHEAVNRQLEQLLQGVTAADVAAYNMLLTNIIDNDHNLRQS